MSGGAAERVRRDLRPLPRGVAVGTRVVRDGTVYQYRRIDGVRGLCAWVVAGSTKLKAVP